MSNLKSSTHLSFRSASDDGIYPELALKAALDSEVFATFRSNISYQVVLEHVSDEQAKAYLQIIKDKYSLSENDILSIIEPLQEIGAPVLRLIEGISKPVSTTALRYLKVALDIKDKFGNDIGDVVEIGCGYGGQAIILDQITNINSYTFFDLWQVNLLITRFIEASPIKCKYNVCTLRNYSSNISAWNLAISNYAISELPASLQKLYIKEVLHKCRNGYMTMNSGLHGKYADSINLPQAKWIKKLPGSKISPEIPLTGPNNYLMTWQNVL